MKSQYIILVMAAFCGIASVSSHVVLPAQKGMPLGICIRRLASLHRHLCALLNETELGEEMDSNSMSSEEDHIWTFTKEKALVNCCMRPCTYSELMYLC